MKIAIKKLTSLILSLIFVFSATIPVGITAFASDPVKFGETVEFGSYPQTKVTDEAILNALNSLEKEWISYNYYSGDYNFGSMVQSDYMKYADVFYNGEKYRAVSFTKYRPTATYFLCAEHRSYQDNNGYYKNNVYWFKWEPVEWIMIDPAEGIFISSVILDSQAFNDKIYWNDKNGNNAYNENEFFNDESFTFSCSDYNNSSLRTWLTNNFYNSVFSENEMSRLGNALNEDYFPNLNDKVFPVSSNIIDNRKYEIYSELTTAFPSDYSKCQGINTYIVPYDGGIQGECYWWNYNRFVGLNSEYRGRAAIVSSSFQTPGYESYNTDCGVRPCIRIPEFIDNNYASPIYLSSFFSADNYEKPVLYGGEFNIKPSCRYLPNGFQYAFYVNNEDTPREIGMSYETGRIKKDMTVVIKVVDNNGVPVKKANGEENSLNLSFTIDNSSGIFSRILAFFMWLFGKGKSELVSVNTEIPVAQNKMVNI